MTFKLHGIDPPAAAREVDPEAEAERVAERRRAPSVLDFRPNDVLRIRTTTRVHTVRVKYVEEVPPREADGFPGGLTIHTVAADG